MSPHISGCDKAIYRSLTDRGHRRSNAEVTNETMECKADMQKRGQPDDGDALALSFAQAVAPAVVEKRDEDEEIFGSVQEHPIRRFPSFGPTSVTDKPFQLLRWTAGNGPSLRNPLVVGFLRLMVIGQRASL
jgi:hypothetical protein